MAPFEQTTLNSAEERFGEVAHSLIRTMKHEYKNREKYGELTDGMRHWKFNLKDICTLLFYHTKEGEENDWHPFSRPLRDLFEEMLDEEAERRANRKLIIRKYQQMSHELDKRG